MFFPSDRMKRVRALVVGDLMLDRYLEGTVSRISPEAPVPVVSLRKSWSNPGGAGNVAASMAALGCRVAVGGILGRDPEAAELTNRLLGIGVERVLATENESPTICKTRVTASGHQQMVRVDQDGSKTAYETAAHELRSRLLPELSNFQVVVLADYEKGTLTRDLLRQVITECRRVGIPCLVDPKKLDFAAYADATLLTPNRMEAERAYGVALETDKLVADAADRFRRELRLDNMVITRGSEGMTLSRSSGIAHFRSVVREVADVAGAGDTVISVLAAGFALGIDVEEACRFAMVAAGIAVEKPGVYAVTARDMERALGGISHKVVDAATAADQTRDARSAGKKIVFTNGCFDVFHAGHLSLLERARRLGGLLVVGLNSDASVRRLKGPTRPIHNELERASLLAGMECVDLVVVFDRDTPEELIRTLSPDVLVKGGDYTPEGVVGGDYVRGQGGEVVILPLIEGLSTTNILKRGYEPSRE